jgi:UrcA family protein
MSVKSFALAAVLTSAIFPLLAEASEPVQTRVVDYTGIDLTTDRGAVILYSRLKNAASSVCRNLESRDLSLSALHEACVSNAGVMGTRRRAYSAARDAVCSGAPLSLNWYAECSNVYTLTNFKEIALGNHHSLEPGV